MIPLLLLNVLIFNFLASGNEIKPFPKKTGAFYTQNENQLKNPNVIAVEILSTNLKLNYQFSPIGLLANVLIYDNDFSQFILISNKIGVDTKLLNNPYSINNSEYIYITRSSGEYLFFYFNNFDIKHVQEVKNIIDRYKVTTIVDKPNRKIASEVAESTTQKLSGNTNSSFSYALADSFKACGNGLVKGAYGLLIEPIRMAKDSMISLFSNPRAWIDKSRKDLSALKENIIDFERVAKEGFSDFQSKSDSEKSELYCQFFAPTGILGAAGKATKSMTTASGRLTSNLSGSSVVLSENKVSILWYGTKGHIELKVGDQVYDTLLGVWKRDNMNKVSRAAKIGGKGFVEFKIRVSKSELQKLESFMMSKEGKGAFQSCVSGACKILKNNTDFNVPIPFRYFPSLTALYLTLAKKLGYSRISDVQFVGSNYHRFVNKVLINETLDAGVIVIGLDELGNQITHFIPIEAAE